MSKHSVAGPWRAAKISGILFFFLSLKLAQLHMKAKTGVEGKLQPIDWAGYVLFFKQTLLKSFRQKHSVPESIAPNVHVHQLEFFPKSV